MTAGVVWECICKGGTAREIARDLEARRMEIGGLRCGERSWEKTWWNYEGEKGRGG